MSHRYIEHTLALEDLQAILHIEIIADWSKLAFDKSGSCLIVCLFVIVCIYHEFSSLKGFLYKFCPFPVEIHITIYGHSPCFFGSKMGR